MLMDKRVVEYTRTSDNREQQEKEYSYFIIFVNEGLSLALIKE